MESVVKGIASIFWATVWANCAEQVDGSLLSGKEITEVMPPIPTQAYFEAYRLLGKVEQLNGMHIACLVDKAIRADKAELTDLPTHVTPTRVVPVCLAPDGEDPVLDAYAERFGNCLAFAYMGDGVSWTDDHAECGVKVPSGETPYDLEELAWASLIEAGYERPLDDEQ